ncbi:ferritin-like domain-containing protein [Turneriella parva]|uniref:DUF455 domain-containing protein n=1 Tax=Turneriella parva (strain ATCC BAA-1111 / DSM 21527 / NCTC 11395 / H) TaxID=869212 RepID=I4BBE0_TURPD|nr:ferritin-like domain-containing protein [Turneriella parva]AFM14597.1 protein of unknown function DUF455 [Turneriella parva DSM 21527]
MKFFRTLSELRGAHDLPQKLQRLGDFAAALERHESVEFDTEAPVVPLGPPSYSAICKIVHGSEVPRRRNLGSGEGRIIFLHALAHIEYSAIDLALDSAYRFRDMPPQFYEDWLNVALDEARHFAMLQSLLGELGSGYGALPVHTGIHDAMVRSEDSLRRRMVAAHRHLEANGLDAHPELARKMSLFDDPMAERIRDALKIIFDDEIAHVAAGDFWYRYACTLDGSNPEDFAADIEMAIPGTKIGGKKNLNLDARRRAGFSEHDLAVMSRPVA